MNIWRLPLWAELGLLGLLALLLLPAMVILRLWTAVLAVAFLIVVSLDRVLPRALKSSSPSLLGQMSSRRQVALGTFLAIVAGLGPVLLDPSPWNAGVAVVVGCAAVAWMAVTIGRKG